MSILPFVNRSLNLGLDRDIKRHKFRLAPGLLYQALGLKRCFLI